MGRKQSPVSVRTDRLVYDHLLGPIQLSWRRNQRQEQQQHHAKHAGLNQLDSRADDKQAHANELNANLAKKQDLAKVSNTRRSQLAGLFIAGSVWRRL